METIKKRKQIDMTQGKLLGKILLFVLPLMASNLLQTFYNAADMMVVGLSSEPDAVGAVGTTGAFINLIVNVFIGFSVGGNVLVARCLGAKDEEGVSRAVHTAICMSLIFGVVGGVIGAVVARPVLVAMGNTGNLLSLGLTYTYIYFAGVPFLSLSNYLISIFRAKGDTRTPLFVLMGTGVLNVVLNLFFVLVVGLSVEGVAIATAIANVASATILLWRLSRDEGPCRFSFRKLSIHRGSFRQIIAIGVPAGVQGALFSISNMLIQSSILKINNRVTPAGAPYEPVVKGNSAALNLENFGFTAVNAVHQAAVTFTGQNAGAGKYDRVKRVMGACYLVEVCVAAAVTMILYLLREPLLAMYSVRAIENDPVAMIAYETAMTRIRVKWAPFVIYAVMDAGNGVLRGLGKSMTATSMALVGTCLFRVVWIYTVFRAFGSLESIYISYPISWAMTGLAVLACALALLSRRIKQQKSMQISQTV